MPGTGLLLLVSLPPLIRIPGARIVKNRIAPAEFQGGNLPLEPAPGIPGAAQTLDNVQEANSHSHSQTFGNYSELPLFGMISAPDRVDLRLFPNTDLFFACLQTNVFKGRRIFINSLHLVRANPTCTFSKYSMKTPRRGVILLIF